MMNMLMIVGLIVVFYFFMIRPQQKKQKEIRKFREGIQKGDQVISAGGIYGKVVRLGQEEIIDVEVAPKTIIQISRFAIQGIVE